MRRLALITASLLALAPGAAAFVGPETKRADLDGDGALERVRSVAVDVPGASFDRTKVQIEDSCRGRALTRRIAGPQDDLGLLRLRNADGLKGREVFVDMRSGAAHKLGEARVVAWRAGVPCNRARNLFHYDTDHHTRTPRGGNGDISEFAAGYRRRRGSRRLDVVLKETFVRDGDPPCCGSIHKTTLWRYSARRDRYVPVQVTPTH